MKLIEIYNNSIVESHGVTFNYFYQNLRPLVEKVEKIKIKSTDEVIESYYTELCTLLKSNPDIVLHPNVINNFSQKIGEAHFYCLCKEKGLVLERCPEQKGIKTPDFSFTKEGKYFYFEVKTPSIVGGDSNIKKHIEKGLDVQLNLEEQLKNSSNATVITETNPYGDAIRKHGSIQGVIKTLSDKINQNFKEEQFTNENTFLVLNLSFIHALSVEAEELRPISILRCKSTFVSGWFWMLAFRRIGMPVFGTQEPPIEHITEKNGILLEHEEITGILLVTNPTSNSSELWGLFRSEMNENTFDILREFTDYRYNDELDSRGLCLNEDNKDFLGNKVKA